MIIRFGEFGDVRELFKAINSQHSQVITLITGKPGHGKSSLACALGLEEMSPRRTHKYKDACNKIDYLNIHKRSNFGYPPEKHLVFSTGFKISLLSLLLSFILLHPF